MKVAILMGSPRKKHSQAICNIIEKELSGKDITFDYIYLSKMKIEECKGCDLCLQKGEQFCPIKDETNMIREKLVSADGIIFVSPVYAYQITSSFKKLVDRLSYLFHRPELVGKPAITIVTSGGGGHKQVTKYLKMVACGWGCHLIDSLEVISPSFFKDNNKYNFFNQKYNDKLCIKVQSTANLLYRTLKNKKLPVPSFYDVYMFNGLKSKTFTSEADYQYWESKGWLSSTYYYNVEIDPIKKLFGFMINRLVKLMWKRMQKDC